MELRGSLGRSVRLFLQRNAVDSVETGSKRRHLSSTSAVVAPLIARQGLEVRLLHDLRHSGSHVGFASLVATHVMKMMAHRQRRRMSLAGVAWGDSSAATRVTALMWDRLQVSDSLPSHAPGTRLARTTTFATSTRARAAGGQALPGNHRNCGRRERR